MLEQIRAILQEAIADYQDPRIHHCRLEVLALEGGTCALTGTVLDTKTCDAVLAVLADRLPGITFDLAQVQVLRAHPPRFLTVATNVTGLFAEPSLRVEMQSQLLNGWQVEILKEEGAWIFTRQADDYLGWAYRNHFTRAQGPRPSHMVSTPVAHMHSEPDPASPLRGRVVAGTTVATTEEAAPWVQVSLAGDLGGWLLLDDLRSLEAMPQDEDGRRQQMLRDGARYTGVPYVWGGCSGLGIDCSGLVQLLHRLVGLEIPRDADMQFESGRPVEPPFQAGDLLHFWDTSRQRTIDHVGMSVGGWEMLHSSVTRNGVFEDNVQAMDLRERFAGARTFLSQ